MIKITFPDNSVKEFESGITPLAIAESISSRLAQDVLVAEVDGEAWDLMRPIEKDAAIKLFKWDDAVNMPSGTHRLTSLPRLCNCSIPVSSLVLVRLWKMVSTTT